MFLTHALAPFNKLLKPFYLSRNHTRETKVKAYSESIQTAIRIALAAGEFFILYQSGIWGFRSYQWLGLTVIYPEIFLFSKIDTESTYYALATLTARIAYANLNDNPSRMQLAKIAFFAMCSFTSLHVSHERTPAGRLKGKIDHLGSYLAEFL